VEKSQDAEMTEVESSQEIKKNYNQSVGGGDVNKYTMPFISSSLFFLLLSFVAV
jgi:hypothetical protein